MTRSTLALTLAAGVLGLSMACASEAEESGAASETTAKAAAPTVTPAMLETGRSIYKANCVACHGVGGKGDGPGAGVLKPPPADHTDREFMSKLTDEEIAKVIQMGGAIKGRPLMPSHPQIRGDDMTALVAYVRSLSEPK